MIPAEYLYTDFACIWHTIATGAVRCGDSPGPGELATRLGAAEVVVEVQRGDMPEVVIHRNPYGSEPGDRGREALALLAYMAVCERGGSEPGRRWRVGDEVVELGLQTLMNLAALPHHFSTVPLRRCTMQSCLFRGACAGHIALFSEMKAPPLHDVLAETYHELVLKGADPLLEIGRVVLRDWKIFSPETLARTRDDGRVRLWLWRFYSMRSLAGDRIGREPAPPSVAISAGHREERNIGLHRLGQAISDVPPHLLEVLLASTADLLSMRRPEYTAESVGGDVEALFKGYARVHRGYIVPTERALTALFGEYDGRRLHALLQEALDEILEGAWKW